MLGRIGGSQEDEGNGLGGSSQLLSLEGPEHASKPLTGGPQGVLKTVLI